jgi:hypothetical protein
MVHAGESVPRPDALAAIDSGLKLLRTIRAIPRVTREVLHAGVTMYSDPSCSTPATHGSLVMMQTYSADGAKAGIVVHPTTRDDYTPGMTVAIEWDMNQKWGEIWYRHPTSSEVHYGRL